MSRVTPGGRFARRLRDKSLRQVHQILRALATRIPQNPRQTSHSSHSSDPLKDEGGPLKLKPDSAPFHPPIKYNVEVDAPVTVA